MKAGMVLAILSGVIALIVGVVMTLVVGAVGGAAGALGASAAAAKSGVLVLALLGLPIMCVVGGALAVSNPKAAIGLTGVPGMLIAALGMVELETGGPLIVLGGLMMLSALLIFGGAKKVAGESLSEKGTDNE